MTTRYAQAIRDVATAMVVLPLWFVIQNFEQAFGRGLLLGSFLSTVAYLATGLLVIRIGARLQSLLPRIQERRNSTIHPSDAESGTQSIKDENCKASSKDN